MSEQWNNSVSIQIKFACFFAKFVELFANLRQVSTNLQIWQKANLQKVLQIVKLSTSRREYQFLYVESLPPKCARYLWRVVTKITLGAP